MIEHVRRLDGFNVSSGIGRDLWQSLVRNLVKIFVVVVAEDRNLTDAFPTDTYLLIFVYDSIGCRAARTQDNANGRRTESGKYYFVAWIRNRVPYLISMLDIFRSRNSDSKIGRSTTHT